jgi:hypothetical protein
VECFVAFRRYILSVNEQSCALTTCWVRLLETTILLPHLFVSINSIFDLNNRVLSVIGLPPFLLVHGLFFQCLPKRTRQETMYVFNPLKTKLRLLYLNAQSVPRSKHFSSRLKNQLDYAVSGTSRCLFSDKYKNADRFIERPSSYRAVNTFHLGCKNQSVYAVSGTSRCLFSDKLKNADRFI